MKNNLGSGIDDLVREARKDTLNKRINYKGNYENFITGGSRALDNQNIMDSNEYAKHMNDPKSGWAKNKWLQELNPRYSNPKHEEEKAYHSNTPSTKRGRRAMDIYWERVGKGEKPNREELIETVNKYEGRK